jgi:hypothetical protein
VRRQVLGLGAQLPVGAGEEQVLGDERVERGDVGGELRGADARLERHDLRVGRADERRLHRREVWNAHRARLGLRCRECVAP